jgi:hypothetical protein
MLSSYKNQSEFKLRACEVREQTKMPSVRSSAGREAPDSDFDVSCLDGPA